jgi:solute:Na+ symporter, SSS family
MGAISLTIYVMISGIHGSVWTAVIKDIMMVAIIGFLGIYLPIHYFGGFQPMFEAVDAAKPGFLKFPDQGLSVSWFISTVILLVFGFYMWPQVFSAVYSARSGKVFRKNAIISPLYTLMLLFVFFVGFTAILKVPGLVGADADLSLLRLSIETFDPWFIGIIGGAGLLTALVPGSMLLMSVATLLAKNVYKEFAPDVSDRHIVRLAKFLVPIIALIAVYFTLNGGETMSALILMGYSLITQLFPSLLFSLKRNNPINKFGAIAGIITGLAIVICITLSQSTIGTLFPSLPQAAKDLNVGIIALAVNFIVMITVSIAFRKHAVQLEPKSVNDI